VVREPFAHDARAVLTSDEPDERALGAAVTRALCGTWEHDGPCPLAAHYTGVLRDDVDVTLRILFAAEPGDEPRVRSLVDAALAAGVLEGPDGLTTRWRLVAAGPGVVRPDEREHAGRLVAS
jgi:hypothetical protein